MAKLKTIGIIGGMGPVSTADLYMRIVKTCKTDFGAHYIRDYPPMLIISVPAPDLVEAIEDIDATLMLLTDAAQKLERGGADFIIIACNSTQFLNTKMQSTISIPIIGIAETVANSMRNAGYKKIGILSTSTTIGKKVYDDAIQSIDSELIRPQTPDQKVVSEVILDAIGGNISFISSHRLINVVDALHLQGAEAILLACTELPLLIKQADVTIPLIDCNEIYARVAAKMATN